VKERSPVTPWFFVRRSGGHPDNSTASLSFANVPDVTSAVATIQCEVYPVSVQVTELTAGLAVFSLMNVLADLALVYREVTAIRANLSRVTTKVAAFRYRTVLVAAPSGLMCECGLRSS
jgi:hypothetical protein